MNNYGTLSYIFHTHSCGITCNYETSTYSCHIIEHSKCTGDFYHSWQHNWLVSKYEVDKTALKPILSKFFMSYSELLSKFGAISFQEYVSKGITHPVFYGDLVYKLRRVKSESNFISSGSKIVKRLRRRQYDPETIERTIGLVLGPFTALYRSFLKRCTLTNKAVGTIWRALSKPPQRRQGPDPRPLWLLVGTPSAFGPELAYRLRVAQPTLMDVPIFLIYFYITIYVCVPHFYDLSALVGCWSSVSIRRIIYKFLNVCPFDCTAVAVIGKVERS